ncbi:MAG TPA: 1-deoxy-D-xylulose-5-phosphate reductoisomerase [Firmicutes bacterium]|nr:1-deoxy-D-xylulose-5-phosphate reductoisomerase [Bacillota bacterium]
MMKKIAVLGATGSIGRQTLEVVDQLQGEVGVFALSAHGNVDLLAEQVDKYHPQVVAISDQSKLPLLRRRLSGWPGRVLSGEQGLVEIATAPEVDLIVSAVVGVAGLVPTYAALQAGKQVALANKETLVAGGHLIMAEANKRNSPLLPVDSEHSAVFQSLMGQDPTALKKIILTASGGPFLRSSLAEMEKVTPEAALAHPTWRMGEKITIDSATLMNKGLEVIEAHWLFGLDYDRIEVVIHPQSVVHSLVELVDGSILAQLGPADMRLPIQFALTYPERRVNTFSRLDLTSVGEIGFYPPDPQRFLSLQLAYAAGRTGGSMPTVLNAANEEAVRLFLGRRIGFTDIWRIVEVVMGEHDKQGLDQAPDLEAIIAIDQWARSAVKSCVRKVLK